MKRSKSQPCKVNHFSKVDSTNRIAHDLGLKGAAHGTVVVAEEQTGGRGRLSRHFSSPRGGLYMSVILRPDISVEKLPLLTLASGIACINSIFHTAAIQIQLKWPNDLYCNGKKIGGILTEAGPYSQADGQVPFIVVGVGLNVNTRLELFPESLRNIASSLYEITRREYSIDDLLQSLVVSILDEVSCLQSDAQEVLARWQEHDYLMGRKVSWHTPQGKVVHGIGNGLLSDGRYRLTTSGGDDYPVLAGDIVITHINGKGVK